jgi:hypothetical protein
MQSSGDVIGIAPQRNRATHASVHGRVAGAKQQSNYRNIDQDLNQQVSAPPGGR